MAYVNATLRSAVAINTKQVIAPGMWTMASTVETGAAATAGTVYRMVTIPTSARISGLSRLAWDDLASTGAPTLDIGFSPVTDAANFTEDLDALNDGLDAATASTGSVVVKAIENYGKTVWEYLGLSSDPGGFANVTVAILDADVNTGGTITMSLVYTVD